MNALPTILLHVNGLARTKAAARLVGRLASRLEAQVVLVATTRAGRRDADAVVSELSLPSGRAEVELRAGSPGTALAEVAQRRDASLAVVPPLGALDAVMGHRVAYSLARRVPRDVLLLRGDEWPVRTILACTEGDRRGVETFERAAELAKALDARLDVLHVLSQMALVAGSPEPAPEEFLASDDPVAAHLRDLQARLRRHALEGSVEVRRGLVDDEIRDAARRHDLLAIGAHDPATKGAFLEDIAGDLVRAAPCSVLLARPRGPPAADRDSGAEPQTAQ